MDSLILPYVNGDCMQIFLEEVAGRHPGDRVIMIVDGAGWHKSAELKMPNNICLINLRPYSPELNPVEHIWDELREKYFHNRVFDSIDALENHLETALRNMENNPDCVYSIVAWPWIINAL